MVLPRDRGNERNVRRPRRLSPRGKSGASRSPKMLSKVGKGVRGRRVVHRPSLSLSLELERPDRP